MFISRRDSAFRLTEFLIEGSIELGPMGDSTPKSKLRKLLFMRTCERISLGFALRPIWEGEST